MLSYSIAECNEMTAGNGTSQQGTINVFTSPGLYHLTMKWVGEFGNLNPSLKINVIKSSDNNVGEFLNKGDGIGFISEESFASLSNQSSWNMVVGRDVIVPVMNAANPLREEIYKKGITSERVARIFDTSEKPNWGMLVDNAKGISGLQLHYYFLKDPVIISGVQNFLHKNQLIIDGVSTASAEEMISAIQKEPNAMGFCKLIQIMDLNNQNIAENIKIIPIDKNGNGKIDYMENIYDNLQTFSRGVWIGKYPKALSGNIYSVSSKKPSNKAELAFLKWVLLDGQQYLNANGYSDLASVEIKSQLDKISEPEIYATSPANESYALLKMLLIVIFGFILIAFAWDILNRHFRNKKSEVVPETTGLVPLFDENSLVIPKGLYFDKTHTWAYMKKDGTVKVGIDDFLQHVTGPLTRIEMKNTGEKIRKDDVLFTIIQKGKQLNIYAPISGTIASLNETLFTDSSLINVSPYTDGWVYTIEPTNWLLEIQFLTMAEKYKTWIKDEFSRLKDFFATAVKAGTPEYALVVLQDGGTLSDSILADLGPEVWEDFQTKFIDNAKIIK